MLGSAIAERRRRKGACGEERKGARGAEVRAIGAVRGRRERARVCESRKEGRHAERAAEWAGRSRPCGGERKGGGMFAGPLNRPKPRRGGSEGPG